jgi:hypothetical protein
MSDWGKGLLVFALFSMACGRQQAPEARAGEPPAESEAAAEEGASPMSQATPAAPAADEAPSSTRGEDDDRATSLGQAIEEFDRARLELSQLLGRDIGPAPEPSPPPAPAAAPAAGAAQAPRDAPKSRAADKASSAREAEAKPLKKGDDGCVNVCRAFDSLTRSAAAVCRLDEGERCRKANQVVAVAKDDAGVRACACKK